MSELRRMSRGRGIAKLVCECTIEMLSYSCIGVLIILTFIFHTEVEGKWYPDFVFMILDSIVL